MQLYMNQLLYTWLNQLCGHPWTSPIVLFYVWQWCALMLQYMILFACTWLNRVCCARGGRGDWTRFWRGCAAGERQNQPMSKGDERTRQAPCLRKVSPWRPICMDPPPNILSSPMPSHRPGGNRITLQIHPVSITPIKYLWLPKSLEIRYLDPSCRDDDKI